MAGRRWITLVREADGAELRVSAVRRDRRGRIAVEHDVELGDYDAEFELRNYPMLDRRGFSDQGWTLTDERGRRHRITHVSEPPLQSGRQARTLLIRATTAAAR